MSKLWCSTYAQAHAGSATARPTGGTQGSAGDVQRRGPGAVQYLLPDIVFKLGNDLRVILVRA
eukprot:scaffold337_cov393-Prasinococcus_capsulatus_cf.AAC.8